MVSITLDSCNYATCECSLPPTRGNMCSHLGSNCVQAMWNFVQNMQAPQCKCATAPSPGGRCCWPSLWVLHPIMISNSDSQRLRFIILEDIIGHTMASWVLRPGNQKVNGQRMEGPGSEWNLSTLASVYKMFTTMCSCVQDVYNCVQAGAGQHWLLWSKYLFVHKQYVCRQYFPTRVQTR